MGATGRQISRADTALHRSSHDSRHPVARGARLARNLVFAAWRPVRALQGLLAEVDRVGWPGDPAVVVKAKAALDGALPYLHDETGEVWR